MRALRTLLILSHRYIGIPLSFMFVLWFVSAFFMIYAGGMPRITPAMQIDGAAPVDFSKVRVTPTEAADIAGFSPSSLRLVTVLGRPAWDFGEPGTGSYFIHADDGTTLGYLDEVQAAQVASDFLDIPVDQFRFTGILENPDQWTVSNPRDMPLYKYSVDDGLGTEAYVSPGNAAVSVYTTRQSRMLAWLGTIPHWLYFTSLRLNQPLWYDIVVWSSGIGCVMALLGLALGITQFRKVRPFSLKRAIPYQGLMRWHYILGVVFGVFTLTWVFSGLLSMEPFAWTASQGVNVDRQLYEEGELDLGAFPPLASLDWDSLVVSAVKQVEFAWIQGQPWLVASYSVPRDDASGKRDRLHQPYNIAGQLEAESVLIDLRSGSVAGSFDEEVLVEKLDAAIPQADAVETSLLTEYDDYYYSRQAQLPLPVLRVKFNDPGASWIYVDPQRSELLTVIDRPSRVERWLYNGLHSLDFAFWYHKRPLWDIGVIVLLLGGLAISVIGLWFGLRRLKADLLALIQRATGNRPLAEVPHASS